MRPRLEPRLYLARSRDRPANWVIRDGGRTIRTGALEHEEDRAGQMLGDYLVRTGRVAGLTADLMPQRPSPSKPSTIYFITCEAPDFPIKIGIASNVNLRIRQLQNALPHSVAPLAQMPGTYIHERILHGLFKHLHMRGEWFRRDAELIEFINRVKTGEITADALFNGGEA